MRLVLVVALLALPLLAGAVAQPPQGIDALIVLEGDAAPAIEDPTGALRLETHDAGEVVTLTINLTAEYLALEIRARGAFAVEGPRQVAPHLRLDPREGACQGSAGACDYTLFERFPSADVRDVDAPARVFFLSGARDDFTLRLGIPGPVNATLSLERDVTPPGFELSAPENVTHYGFFQATTTDELAIGDLQVRRLGSPDWVRNPTPAFHVLQRFPVQGLDADTTYEARVVYEDWSGNRATSETYTVHTLPEPARPLPLIEILAPAPGATVAGSIAVRASIESPGSPIAPGGVRVFFDKTEVTPSIRVQDGIVEYVPGPLAPGRHSASVEVLNEAGGKAVMPWTFEVEGETRDAPWGGIPALLAAVGTALLLRRR